MLEALDRFSSAVLTTVDDHGYPSSVRVEPRITSDATVEVDPPAESFVHAGPASLAAHSHDEDMWDLHEILFTGTLERSDGDWSFRCEERIPGGGFGGPLEGLKFVTRSRRRARRYLEHRDLERPDVDWARVEELRRRSLTESGPWAHPGRWEEFPEEVERVIRRFRTAELTVLARDGSPLTWPIAPFYDPETKRFESLGSIGYPGKLFAMRRDPKVSLLFSDPKASGIDEPPAILVQGDAEAPDEILLPGDPRVDPMFLTVFSHQPTGIAKAVSNPISKYLMDWYLMRLPFHITPRRVVYWPEGDFAAPPVDVTPD